MISCTRHGVVPTEHENGFAEYLESTGVQKARELEGNRGAYVTKITRSGYCHFFLCTVWETWLVRRSRTVKE